MPGPPPRRKGNHTVASTREPDIPRQAGSPCGRGDVQQRGLGAGLQKAIARDECQRRPPRERGIGKMVGSQGNEGRGKRDDAPAPPTKTREAIRCYNQRMTAQTAAPCNAAFRGPRRPTDHPSSADQRQQPRITRRKYNVVVRRAVPRRAICCRAQIARLGYIDDGVFAQHKSRRKQAGQGQGRAQNRQDRQERAQTKRPAASFDQGRK